VISEQAIELHYPFLVHDTVCPWLAPWSPVEEKS
jgi:hypothetical protein